MFDDSNDKCRGANKPRLEGRPAAGALITAALTGAVMTMSALPASAAVHHPATRAASAAVASGHPPCWSMGRFSKYRKFLTTSKQWPNSPQYRVSGWGPNTTLRLSKSVSVANKVSATFGVSKAGISATVGFDVTRTWTTGLSYSAKLKKKKHYTLRAARIYKVYAFNVYEKRGAYRGRAGCVYTGKNVWVGTGKAYKFWTFDFKLTAA